MTIVFGAVDQLERDLGEISEQLDRDIAELEEQFEDDAETLDECADWSTRSTSPPTTSMNKEPSVTKSWSSRQTSRKQPTVKDHCSRDTRRCALVQLASTPARYQPSVVNHSPGAQGWRR